MRLAFDIETNGLLPELKTIHSLCIKDIDSGKTWSLRQHIDPVDHNVADGLKLLQEAEYITGHNILSYDIPAIQKLYPWFKPKGIVRDTLIMAKMIWPVDRLKELDFPRWRSGDLPGNLIGAHRLEAWGYRMKGMGKGEYSKTVKELSKQYQEHGDLELIPSDYRVLASYDDKGRPCLDPWLAWNQPMQDYCDQDVEVTVRLHKLIEGHLDGTGKAAMGVGWSERSVELEHKVWQHISRQEERGYGFDKDGAVELASELKTRQRELEGQLIEAFGSWWQPLDPVDTGKTPAKAYNEKLTQFPDVTIKKFSAKTDKELKPYIGPPLASYSPDAPFVRIEWTTFNPKSRQHLGDRLQVVFGWKPVEFGGKNGDQAKVDETTIKAIPEDILPEALRETILEYLVISKTLGQLADGKKSWIDLTASDGRLHGRMDPLGTVSHRGAHMDPNLGQVPGVKKAKGDDGNEHILYGWKGGFGVESRRLFVPGVSGWYQTGVDASGLELRLLGHYLEPYDGGEFSRRVSSPGLDIHAENAKVTGLPRGDTKTVTYAFLYGAGPLKIGMGVGVPADMVEELGNSPQARQYVSWLKRVMRNKFVQPDVQTLAYVVKGQQVQKAFLEGITGLKDFKKDITELATKQGFIVALDGRKLHIRKAHAAINQLLQGGGAIVCKEWMLETDRLLREHYDFTYSEDYAQMAWVHDEMQFEHREEEMGVIIQEASQKSIEHVAESLSFRGKLATDGKTGRSWFDCH
ncbi:DNA polymerase [Brucella intermedia]|uniref:DNA polymerase n=1 Tax=Brucella intermedia TaxID=94625 RepID=UPI00224B1DF2|nr:DNA polymerase [Brucella intermedia]